MRPYVSSDLQFVSVFQNKNFYLTPNYQRIINFFPITEICFKHCSFLFVSSALDSAKPTMPTYVNTTAVMRPGRFLTGLPPIPRTRPSRLDIDENSHPGLWSLYLMKAMSRQALSNKDLFLS